MDAPILSCGQEAIGTLQFTDINRKPWQSVAWIGATNIPGARLQARSLLLPSRLPQQDSVVDQAGGQIRVVGGQRFLLNGDGAPVKGFGFAEFPLVGAGRSQIIQHQRYLRVIGTEPVLCDRESLGRKLLRLGRSLETPQNS